MEWKTMLPPARAHRLLPTGWDIAAFAIVLALFAMVAAAGEQMLRPLAVLNVSPVTLDPWQLPDYALRTTVRMLAALAISLVFTFVYATVAAKSRRAELILIPILDILQSVPILGFISLTVAAFMAMAPGRVLGAEFAAIFAIFTSQAWNMTFSFYQSLRTLPEDLDEAARSLRFSPWLRFWRVEVPFAMPGLIWNMMMSMSGGWFFVVAAEAITVGNTTITLPGIGSYIALAIERRSLTAVAWAILAMLIVILIYDQLLFRPLVAWADRFRFEQTPGEATPASWFLTVVRRSRLIQVGFAPLRHVAQWSFRASQKMRARPAEAPSRWTDSRLVDRIWIAAIAIGAVFAVRRVLVFVLGPLSLAEVAQAFGFGLITLARVVTMIALASLVWVPVGVTLGLRPKWARIAQPIAQFLAAFPANLTFPLAVFAIVRFHLNPDIWVSPLMVFGTQWYILFNVIAGASTLPRDLTDTAANLRIRGWLWWRKVALPGVFPYYLTGAVTASGGSWNASIVAELVSWGDEKLVAHGIGSYIAQATEAANYPRIVLGIAVMSVFVTVFNRLLWRPLYRYAERRCRLA
ncbi:MAG TPA: ABC transporter permease subunit [Alphaproteobacteria bacterium]|nr:ABC transporter permease subunit [Alphaproteobacteria bacterium]